MIEQELLKYAKKRYPLGSYYVSNWESKVSKVTSDFLYSEAENSIHESGKNYVFYKNKWAENCDKNGNIIPYVETEKIIELW